MYAYDFGKRRATPCFDCDPKDGHCTMNCSPAKKVTAEEHTGDFRRALELADKLTEDNQRLRDWLDHIHGYALTGQDDAATGFINICGMVRDALKGDALIDNGQLSGSET